MKIGIVGLGLIGGSLAIDFKEQGHQIWGVSRKESTCKTALEKGIVDHACLLYTSPSPRDLSTSRMPSSA